MDNNLVKIIGLSLILFCLLQSSYCQITIMPLPTSNIYFRSQLWNLSVSNVGTAPVEARLQIKMKDIRTQDYILSGMSATFNLRPGLQVLNSDLLEPIVYHYESGASQGSYDNTSLSVGQYQICYQLFFTANEDQVIGADDCEDLVIEPLSPPLLIIPENDSTVIESNPNFSWTPPSPITMFSELNYDILISEVYEGQSINAAIQENIPVQHIYNLQQSFLSYPLSGAQLEKGKKYVWQVVAKDQQIVGSKSDVWSFFVPDQNEIKSDGNLIYLQIDDKANGIGIVKGDTLNLKYISYMSPHTVSFAFRDGTGREIESLSRKIMLGENFFKLPLNKKFQKGERYTMLLIDDEKSKSFTFTIE